MKRILTIIIVVFLLILAATAIFAAPLQPLTPEFKAEMNMVEASGKKANVTKGDKGLACGPMQIHLKYWEDATEYDKTIGGTYADCEDYAYSVKVVTAYLNRYGRQYIIANDYKALARIHNGGPSGHIKKNTLAYWQKYKFARSGVSGRG